MSWRASVVRVLGGPARARVVVLFAGALALESADLATVGAAGPQLRSALHISNTELGLLAGISTLVGAIVTIPFGVLADRVARVRLLYTAVALWAVAMAFSAAAQSYEWLLLSRLGLGAVTAAAGPAIASLTGDFFPASERGKIYGYILSGELVGAGFGFVISGSLAAALSWRWSFGVLTLPAAALVLLLRRLLPEPARGGASRLEPGAERILSADDVPDGPERQRYPGDEPRHGDGLARRAVAENDVAPVHEHVLTEDPGGLGLGRAVMYVLRIRTNRWLIAASAMGYFFLAGLRTFGLAFVRGHFALGQTSATLVLFLAGLGSLAGVLVAGRLADRLIRNGTLDGRVLVPAICFIAAAVTLLPSVLLSSVWIGIPLLVVSGAMLSAPNPPLDAARLDIMPAQLWGRAEGVRTFIRQSAQAGAPLLFGVLADVLGGGGGAFGSGGRISAASASGLRWAFLIMLAPLALNGVALFVARRSYPADVATALETERHAERPAPNATSRARTATKTAAVQRPARTGPAE